MKRLPLLTLIFALLSAVFFLLLIFLRIPSPLYPLMSIQDSLDLLTPLVLIPIYWLLFTHTALEPPSSSHLPSHWWLWQAGTCIGAVLPRSWIQHPAGWRRKAK